MNRQVPYCMIPYSMISLCFGLQNGSTECLIKSLSCVLLLTFSFRRDFIDYTLFKRAHLVTKGSPDNVSAVIRNLTSRSSSKVK